MWDSAAQARIDEALASATPGDYLAFDFDNTCIWQDIGESFMRALVRSGALATQAEVFWESWDAETADVSEAWTLAEAARTGAPDAVDAWLACVEHAYMTRCQVRGKADGYSWAVQLMAGMREADVLAAADAHIPEALALHHASIDAIRVHDELRQTIAQAHARGVEVWFVSASSWWIVQAGARLFGVEPQRVLGNRVEVKDGALTAAVVPPHLVFEGKVEVLRAACDGRAPLLMFGDSMTDSDVMRWARFGGIIIDRGVEALQELAAAQGWIVQPREALTRLES